MSGARLALVLLMGIMLIYDGYCLGARPMATSLKFMQSGVASWYGREQNGLLTANGETFNRHELTAASRHLPFNTVVRVTNEKNGHSVDVRINDRGPFSKGRVLDLSEAAADSLDMKKSGTAPVKIEMVQPASAEAVPSP
jgi:rare lipoprotein A